jgi:hypothetical protein
MIEEKGAIETANPLQATGNMFLSVSRYILFAYNCKMPSVIMWCINSMMDE